MEISIAAKYADRLSAAIVALGHEWTETLPEHPDDQLPYDSSVVAITTAALPLIESEMARISAADGPHACSAVRVLGTTVTTPATYDGSTRVVMARGAA